MLLHIDWDYTDKKIIGNVNVNYYYNQLVVQVG